MRACDRVRCLQSVDATELANPRGVDELDHVPAVQALDDERPCSDEAEFESSSSRARWGHQPSGSTTQPSVASHMESLDHSISVSMSGCSDRWVQVGSWAVCRSQLNRQRDAIPKLGLVGCVLVDRYRLGIEAPSICALDNDTCSSISFTLSRVTSMLDWAHAVLSAPPTWGAFPG